MILAAPNESTLRSLCTEATIRGIVNLPVFEPDLDDAMAALALEPSTAARRLVSNLPLAMKT